MVNWLTIELTNDCNRSCFHCGRAKVRSKNEMEIGYIDMGLFKHIISQYKGEILQFSKDGDPLLHPHLHFVGRLSSPFVSGIVTNGLLLYERREEIINNFTTVTVSVVDDNNEQFESIKKYVEFKNGSSPLIFIKFLGDYHNPEYEKLGLKTMRRSIHNPEGDMGYKQSKPPIPELGVCIDFLTKPSIDWRGKFHICNRFDIEGNGVIGDCKKQTLDEIWRSPVRQEWLKQHKQGDRGSIPLCATCNFWGYPAC